MMRSSVSGFAVFFLGEWLLGCGMDPAAARAKLASNDPKERERAAQVLRGAYAKDHGALGDHGDAFWAERLRRVVGTDQQAAQELLPGARVEPGSEGGGGGHSVRWRLDDFWVTTAWMSDRGDARYYSVDPPRRFVVHVDVERPADYTGTWTTYYVNGAVHEIAEITQGRYERAREYWDNGQLTTSRTWANGLLEGRVVRYYPNGSVEDEETWAAGKLVGVKRWYWPNGKVRQDTPYKDGKLDGPLRNFSEDGAPSSCILYRDGARTDAGCERAL